MNAKYGEFVMDNEIILYTDEEGNREVKREIDHYNLDVIIAIGYRVQSDVAVRFRRWAREKSVMSRLCFEGG
jgi:hypothetical protein